MSRTAGREALAAALPTWAGVLTVAGVLFSRNGLTAADVAVPMASLHPVRWTLLIAWALLMFPATRALLLSQVGTLFRAVPTTVTAQVSVHFVLLVALQLPLLVVCVRGSGPWLTLHAVMAVLSVQCALSLLSRRGARGIIAQLETGALLLVALGFTPWVWLDALIASPVCVRLVLHAWRYAPEQDAVRRSVKLSRRPALALGGAWWLMFRRAHTVTLVRAVLFSVAAGAVSTFVVLNHGGGTVGETLAVVCALAPVLLIVPVFMVAQVVVSLERQSHELLDAGCTNRQVRLRATELVTVGLSVGFATLAWVSFELMQSVVRHRAVGTVASLGVWVVIAVSLAWLIEWVLRRSVETTNAVGGSVGLVLVLSIVAGATGPWSLLGIAALGMLARAVRAPYVHRG